MPVPPAELQLSISEEKLNAVIESTPDPFIIVGSGGIIERVNRQAEKFFGYSRDELVGQSFKLLVPERFRAQHDVYTRQYRQKAEMREMGSGLALSCLHRSGEEIPVEIGLSPVVVDNDTTIMVRFRDIRREQQEQAALRQALDKADEANRTKTRFLAAASHDLRQPLQSISMYLGALGGHLDENGRTEVIEKARAAVDTTNRLLDALLNITKLESGKVQPEISSFNIATLLERVHDTEAQSAREKQQELCVIGSTASVRSDPVLLEQLVTNFVANAIRYTPPHGHIVVGCRRLPHHLKIQVSDNGPGIASGELDLIFDEYRQLHNESQHRGKGLGLGLSIVKLISELLDLQLEVKSTPGRGSSFGVLVPLADERIDRQRPVPATLAKPVRPTGRVLLIDDDAAVLDSTALFLQLSGYAVETADSPEAAMAKVALMTPDIIITDYGLARRENGFELLGRLRQALGRDVPALVVTGDTSEVRAEEARAVHCELLRKPVDIQQLLQLLRQWS